MSQNKKVCTKHDFREYQPFRGEPEVICWNCGVAKKDCKAFSIGIDYAVPEGQAEHCTQSVISGSALRSLSIPAPLGASPNAHSNSLANGSVHKKVDDFLLDHYSSCGILPTCVSLCIADFAQYWAEVNPTNPFDMFGCIYHTTPVGNVRVIGVSSQMSGIKIRP